MDIEYILRNRYRDIRICAECVDEPDLQTYITDSKRGCTFCEQSDASTCNFLDFMDHVKTCIEAEYDLAVDRLPWESREGGWLLKAVWDTADLLTDELGVGLPRDTDGRLLKSMVDCLGGSQDWCVRNPYGEDPLYALRTGWKRFCHLVQHHTRFFLDRWASPSRLQSHGDTYPTPAEVLHAIGNHITRLELCRDLPAGTTFYRVRHCMDGRRLQTPAELGPPSTNDAVMSNRMSPPGVVMFYAALDPETALTETVKDPGRYAIGAFCNRRPTRLLDLTQLPKVPGIFASIPDSQPWTWRHAQFFHDLVADLARPIERDDRIHVEYIPTQVVTEYCRLAFHHEHNTMPLDGILYPSARNPEHAAVVLFADRSAIVGVELITGGETDVTWLELIGVEHHDLAATDIEHLKSRAGLHRCDADLSFRDIR